VVPNLNEGLGTAPCEARITDKAGGTVIARDGEAEDWIARHIGASDGGPTGLLWVRQGVLGLEPADAKPAEKDRLAEARRDLLSSVAGEIEQVTGGRTMDRILRRCQEDLDALATGSRLSPKGAWKDAVDAAKGLEGELDVLERQCAELSDALNDRRAAEAELQRLDEPAAKAQRDTDLAEAREAARAAESYAQKIASAQGELDLALMQQSEADRSRCSDPTFLLPPISEIGSFDAEREGVSPWRLRWRFSRAAVVAGVIANGRMRRRRGSWRRRWCLVPRSTRSLPGMV